MNVIKAYLKYKSANMINKMLKDSSRKGYQGNYQLEKRFNHKKEISSDIDSELTGIIHFPVFGTVKRSSKKQKRINKSYRRDKKTLFIGSKNSILASIHA